MKMIPPSDRRLRWVRCAAVVCAAFGLFLVLSWAAQESWNAGTGSRQSATQVLGLGEVVQAAYAPDGRKVALATTAGIEVWNAGTWELERHLIGHNDVVQSVAWSPDSSKIASGADDGTIRIWDARTGQTLQILEGDFDGILSKDLFYRILLKLGDFIRNYRTEGFKLSDESVRAVSWSPDGHRIVSVARSYSVKLWDAHTGKLLRVYTLDDSYERGAIWSPDGRMLIVYTDRGATITCEAQAGNVVKTIDFKDAVTCSPDGRKVAVSDHTHRIHIWDVQMGDLLATLAEEARFGRPQAWSPDGRKLAYVALGSNLENDVLNVWDVQTGRISTVAALGNTSTWGLFTWSPDARKLLIPGKPLRLWDAQNEALLELPPPGDRIRSIAWAPDAHTFILVGQKTITVWDAQTGNPIETLTGRSEQPSAMSWSPDGRKLAAYTDGMIKIWDLEAGAVVNTLTAHTDRVLAVAWASDTYLLTIER